MEYLNYHFDFEYQQPKEIYFKAIAFPESSKYGNSTDLKEWFYCWPQRFEMLKGVAC